MKIIGIFSTITRSLKPEEMFLVLKERI